MSIDWWAAKKRNAIESGEYDVWLDSERFWRANWRHMHVADRRFRRMTRAECEADFPKYARESRLHSQYRRKQRGWRR